MLRCPHACILSQPYHCIHSPFWIQVHMIFLQWIPWLLRMSRPGEKITRKSILMQKKIKELDKTEVKQDKVDMERTQLCFLTFYIDFAGVLQDLISECSGHGRWLLHCVQHRGHQQRQPQRWEGAETSGVLGSLYSALLAEHLAEYIPFSLKHCILGFNLDINAHAFWKCFNIIFLLHFLRLREHFISLLWTSGFWYFDI